MYTYRTCRLLKSVALPQLTCFQCHPHPQPQFLVAAGTHHGRVHLVNFKVCWRVGLCVSVCVREREREKRRGGGGEGMCICVCERRMARCFGGVCGTIDVHMEKQDPRFCRFGPVNQSTDRPTHHILKLRIMTDFPHGVIVIDHSIILK
jgi:hypothetical protein